MSQRDVLAELRAVRVEAPPELRERVRLVAAAAPPERPRRRLDWRRALVVAVPVAAAVAVAVVVTRPAHRAAPFAERQVLHGAPTVAGAGAAAKSLAVPVSPRRVQTVAASVSLQVADVPAAVARATQVATSLSGYVASLHEQTSGSHGTATLVLRVPRSHAQAAVTRLSRLGTVLSQRLDLTDRQAGLNSTAEEIRALRKELAQTTGKKARAALVARIRALGRSAAATRRTAHFATVRVALRTNAPAKAHRQRHVLRAVGWAAAGAAVLALLLLAWRLARRLRERALLSRP